MSRVEYLADHLDLLKSVERLTRDQWKHTAVERTDEEWLEQLRVTATRGEIPCTLVALHDEALVGFVTLVRFEERSRIRNGVWMVTLYVKQPFRDQGVGQMLIERCIEEAAVLGESTAYLWAENQGLSRYYRQRGWHWAGMDETGGDVLMFPISAI